MCQRQGRASGPKNGRDLQTAGSDNTLEVSRATNDETLPSATT